MQNSEIKTVIIDLDTSKSANKFGNDQLMHKPAFEKIKSLITERIEHINDIRFDDRIHETISILGSRGSGKSSLLLSIENNISDEIKNNVEILRPIDPTLFESRQNILITLIALIQEQVNKISNCEKMDDQKHNEWLRSLRKLAEGLNALDGVGKNSLETDIWSDPQIILEKGLKQAISEEQLETNFYNFIENSLELLNKKFLLVLFDDIDTSFDKGEEVLETLRKYLRYPKIISMLAGDMDLFIKLVRRKNWPQFEILLKNEDYNKQEIRSTIDHLEEQYLLKVLPSPSRIELSNLYELVQQNWQFEFRQNSKKYIDINSNYKDSSNLLVILDKQYFKTSPYNSFDKEYFVKAFLSLPMRTIIQLIRTHYEYKDELSNVFLLKILTLFSSLSSSYQMPKTHSLLDRQRFVSELAMLLTKNYKKIDIAESYRLKPIFSEDETNTLMLILNMLANHYLSDYKANVFGYFIKVGLTRETLLSWPYNETATGFDFIRHIGLNENELPIKMTRRYCGFIYDMTSTRSYYNGYIKTYMHQDYLTSKSTLKSSDKEPKTISKYVSEMITKEKITSDHFTQDVVKKLDLSKATDAYQAFMQKLVNNHIEYKKSLLVNTHITLNNKLENITDKFLLNLLFMQVSSAYASTNSYASIFPLVGLMSELMMKEGDNLETFIINHIRTLSQIRTFVAFNGKTDKVAYSLNASSEENEEDESNDEIENEVIFDFDIVTEIKEWISQLSTLSESLPVHILAKIWTRFYYSLESIATHKNNKHLGRIISLQITQFLNAWIIETLIYTQPNVNVRLTNIVTSVDDFKHNFKEFEGKMKEQSECKYLAFCDLVLKFPLWNYYLDENTQKILKPDGEIQDRIKCTINKNELGFASLEPLLNTILIAKLR
jgi:ABC-type dipeptide/oligopeptide/nickel transport system ATPase component